MDTGEAGNYKYPRWIEIVSELSKNATGKIQRFKLREEGKKRANALSAK